MLKMLFGRKICHSIAAIPIFVISNWAYAVDPVSNWDPASGLKPNEISEPYELVNTYSAPPVLDSGKLIMSTPQVSYSQFYIQREPLVDPSRKFTMSMKMRLVSGTSITEFRAPIGIFFTIEPSVGLILWIDVDRVFFGIDRFVNGPISNVDTDDAMHTYRIEHDGAGNFTLFHDDIEILSASAFESTQDHGTVRRFAFGDGTNGAYGVSEWGLVTHNFLDPIFKDGFEDPLNTISVVDDSVSSVGKYTSIAIGVDGYPVISYNDLQNDSLKVAKCNDTKCADNDETITTVDKQAESFAGEHTSIAIGADGFPIISHFDSVTPSLRIVKCNDAACTGVDETITVADSVGGRSSIAIGNDDLPVLSYFDATNSRLKVMKCNDAACAGGDEIITILDDPDNEVGAYNSLAIGNDGFPVISYNDGTDGSLYVAKCNDAACAGHDETITVIDDTANNVGEYNSLALGADGFPVISYWDSNAGTLKVAKCNDAACAGDDEIVTIVDDGPEEVGSHTAIAVPADGFPVIAYQDITNLALKIIKCNDTACTGGDEIATVVDDTPIWVGVHNSIAIGDDGSPIVSYFDVGSNTLRVIHCGEANCIP